MIKLLSYMLYGVVRLISYLPSSILYFFSDILFLFVYHIFRYRRKVVTSNLKNSFPEKSEKEIQAIRKEFYCHFCDTFIETIKLWTISEKEIRKRCKFIAPEILNTYKTSGKSVVIVFGHYGNWEWLTSINLWIEGYYLPIYKPLHNKVFDKMFLQIRKRFGARPLAKNDTLRTMISYRNQNKFTTTIFIGDQTPNKRNLNYWTKFLNQDTPVLLGTERIAKKLDQPVIFVHMKKIKRGHYEVHFIPLFDNPKATAEFEITETHTRVLEDIIKEEPAYWLWSHKRWKHTKQDSQ
ncbi:lipid A biosynthesis acyltransferase [Labilibaculum manganireducens]|uniref:Lipid A biosynthesis acyltransferase n=1 Tax=Labilibaculum manganireducens TaxID=1940525 RepID=A0A2N3ICZ0_9BACT|nr:lysophospholipid acyltransferase family protein [Labilibaculum manganireducens]PKQ68214.1 lipid A biosynthesis acyltransferase [Labilibaculum manganireducens]